MAGRKTLRVELDELRKEVAELRNSRAEIRPPSRNHQAGAEKSSSKTDADPPKEMPVSANADHDLKHIESAIKGLTEAGEKEIEKNPLLAVGLAFLLGLLIGRTTR